jgi:integrase
MVMAGVPFQQVAHYLGHKSTRMVEQVYGHFAPDYLSDAAKAVDLQLLRPVKKVG